MLIIKLRLDILKLTKRVDNRIYGRVLKLLKRKTGTNLALPVPETKQQYSSTH